MEIVSAFSAEAISINRVCLSLRNILNCQVTFHPSYDRKKFANRMCRLLCTTAYPVCQVLLATSNKRQIASSEHKCRKLPISLTADPNQRFLKPRFLMLFCRPPTECSNRSIFVPNHTKALSLKYKHTRTYLHHNTTNIEQHTGKYVKINLK